MNPEITIWILVRNLKEEEAAPRKQTWGWSQETAVSIIRLLVLFDF